MPATPGLSPRQYCSYVSPANRIASAGLGVTQPLFDGFTLLHQKLATEAAFAQARAQYHATVIAAVQNVADTLHALQEDANALRAASEYEKAAKVSFDLVQQQFERGYVNTLLMLNARTDYLSGAACGHPGAGEQAFGHRSAVSSSWRRVVE